MNKAYAKLLLEPLWKARRAAIILRDQNRCVECGDEDNLHVHHRYYESDKKPWEYPDEAMITLCKACHDSKHRGNSKQNPFVKIYELALLIRLAKHDPMAAEVLTWLIYRMDSHNRATMVMLAMAEDLKCHRTTIKRKLDRLVALNFIQRGRYRGETVVDVNPLLCNRTNTMYHYFQPPIELPTEDELDAYFAQFKKTPEFECDLETGEIHE